MTNHSILKHLLLALVLGLSTQVAAKKTATPVKTQSVESDSLSAVSKEKATSNPSKSIAPTKDKKAAALVPERLSIMSFNVENLFDTIDDPITEDETYLPKKLKKNNPEIAMRCQRLLRDYWREQCLKTDWTERRLKRKMHRLADVIRKANNKKGPDVLIMPEIENLGILERFRKEYLSDLYPEKAILIEGPDTRGIDVGILTRLKLKSEPTLHQMKFIANEIIKEEDIRPTRGILETELILPTGESLFVFGVHFPSQGAPTEHRRQALAQLVELMKSKPQDSYIVAGGDFNITREEDAEHKYFVNVHESGMQVSHFVGCKGCRGTHYYHPKRSWSFLDALIFAGRFADANSPWQFEKESVQVFNKSIYQINRYGSPARFGLGNTKEGVSDHWPIIADITYKKPIPKPQLILGDSSAVQLKEITSSSALDKNNSVLTDNKKKVLPLNKATKPDSPSSLKKAL